MDARRGIGSIEAGEYRIKACLLGLSDYILAFSGQKKAAEQHIFKDFSFNESWLFSKNRKEFILIQHKCLDTL